MKYHLQESRGREAWRAVDDYPRDATDLAAWKDIGDNLDCYEGRYHYRIIDESGAVMWTKIAPYEGVEINLVDPPQDWLESIRADYGIDKDVWAAACRAWLDSNP